MNGQMPANIAAKTEYCGAAFADKNQSQQPNTEKFKSLQTAQSD